jgi:uncharacterized DUF497 family protein
MQFAWDSANTAHIARHQIIPDEAEQVIQNEPLDVKVQLRNGEERMLHLGETDSGRVLVVVVTERNEQLRVVTARPANKKERAFYAAQKGDL